MPNVFGELVQAQLESIAGNSANTPDGMVWLDTSAAKVKVVVAAGVKSVVTETGTATLQNKTLDNTNIATIKAANLTVQDGADTTKQAKLDASGISTATTRTYSLPDASVTLVGNNNAQVITNKDIDGLTASNSSRITVPKNTKTNLDGLTRKEATLVYATDQSKLYVDNGTSLSAVGGGGGGGSLQWVEYANAPIPSVENLCRNYLYSSGLSQNLYALVRVSDAYVSGGQIRMKMAYYSPDAAGTVLLQTVSTLVRKNTDLITSTTNQRTSTNTAVTMSGANQSIPLEVIFDLTSSTGTINSVAVSPGDLIIVNLTRGTDSATSDIRALVYGAEVLLS